MDFRKNMWIYQQIHTTHFPRQALHEKNIHLPSSSYMPLPFPPHLTNNQLLNAMIDPAAPPTSDPIAELLTTYNELNSSSIDELTEIPSPLEFMRYVSRNRPFVVRGGASDWKATRTWSVDVLKERMAGMRVNVAITPKG